DLIVTGVQTCALPIYVSRGGLSMGWTRKHLLTMQELDASEIVLLIDTAASLQEIATREIKKVPALRGKTIVNLFYEPSTRTRTSFEIAGKWLSADVINFASSGSSTTKGESFIDTAKNIAAMSPVGVIAHSRVARSDIHGMRKLGMTVTVAGPPTLIPAFVQELGVKVSYRLEDAIRDVDVIMMLRLQHERMTNGLVPSLREYSRYW